MSVRKAGKSGRKGPSNAYGGERAYAEGDRHYLARTTDEIVRRALTGNNTGVTDNRKARRRRAALLAGIKRG